MATPSFYPHTVLAPNRLGDDYVVGDIHGAFTKLREHLDALGFNPTRDRLLSVGDLVDRNPNGVEALAWLRQPWFFAVRGNHENMFLAWHFHPRDPYSQEYVNSKNGGSWALELPPTLRDQLVTAFQQLPYVLSVPYRSHWLALAHANLPSHPVVYETGGKHPLTRQALFNQLVSFNGKLIENLTWNRSRLRGAIGYDQLSYWSTVPNSPQPPVVTPSSHPPPHHVPGYDLLVVGHSTLTAPCFLGDFAYLDTGGWIPNCPFTVARLSDLLAAHAALASSGALAGNCLTPFSA